MSNSKLVSFTQLSPNCNSPRNHKIDTITIHCVVGQLSVETMGHMFAQKSYNASCNYAIGSDGRIALIVEEENRSWCSSSLSNDHRAITIECASEMIHPYEVNSKVYKSLINLLVDICQRNDIKELRWKADKSLVGKIDKQNMTVHRWFDEKECPGDYLYNRHGQIAEEVNARLGNIEIQPEEEIKYYTRKSWTDKKTQFGAYIDLNIAKKNCPVGYTVFDAKGKALYKNEGTNAPVAPGTDNIWMGWVKRETGRDGLRNIHGDGGKAYGLQFDYRYGLIPFLKFCLDFDRTKYAAFKKFIDYGAGNAQLVYNSELGRLWQKFYDADPEEFEQLQYVCAYEDYYLPAREYIKKHYDIDLDFCSPTLKGTIWSMAFRSGSETAAKKMSGMKGKPEKSILDVLYATYGTSDAGRWTKAGQWGDAMKALEDNEYTVLDVTIDKKETTDKTEEDNKFPYMVRVKIHDLRIREEPRITSLSKGFIFPGSYTIIKEVAADGYTWGKLISGTGWIALEYTERV